MDLKLIEQKLAQTSKKFEEQQEQYKQFQKTQKDKKSNIVEDDQQDLIRYTEIAVQEQTMIENQKKINQMDRLKTLKALSSVYGNLVDKQIEMEQKEDTENAFQEFIDGKSDLKKKYDKIQQIQKVQKTEFIEKKLEQKNQVNNFIMQQQKKDAKFCNTETQYELPPEYEEILKSQQIRQQQEEFIKLNRLQDLTVSLEKEKAQNTKLQQKHLQLQKQFQLLEKRHQTQQQEFKKQDQQQQDELDRIKEALQEITRQKQLETQNKTISAFQLEAPKVTEQSTMLDMLKKKNQELENQHKQIHEQYDILKKIDGIIDIHEQEQLEIQNERNKQIQKANELMSKLEQQKKLEQEQLEQQQKNELKQSSNNKILKTKLTQQNQKKTISQPNIKQDIRYIKIKKNPQQNQQQPKLNTKLSTPAFEQKKKDINLENYKSENYKSIENQYHQQSNQNLMSEQFQDTQDMNSRNLQSPTNIDNSFRDKQKAMFISTDSDLMKYLQQWEIKENIQIDNVHQSLRYEFISIAKQFFEQMEKKLKDKDNNLDIDKQILPQKKLMSQTTRNFRVHNFKSPNHIDNLSNFTSPKQVKNTLGESFYLEQQLYKQPRIHSKASNQKDGPQSPIKKSQNPQ